MMPVRAGKKSMLPFLITLSRVEEGELNYVMTGRYYFTPLQIYPIAYNNVPYTDVKNIIYERAFIYFASIQSSFALSFRA